MDEMRICNKCNISKPIDDFEITNDRHNHRYTCWECRLSYLRANNKKRGERNLAIYGTVSGKPSKWRMAKVFPNDINKTRRTCRICKLQKPITEFEYTGNNFYRYVCKTCHQETNVVARRKRFDRNVQLYGTIHNPKEKARVSARNRGRRIKDRLDAIKFYGGRCECCGESRIEMLTFDHIGHIGAKGDDKSSSRYYKNKIEAGYPNGKYRLLCWNCNATYGFYGYCPHKTNGHSEVLLSESRRYNRKLKREMINAYGGKCIICGESHFEFMTIDHINGGGTQHMKQIRCHHGTMYKWLKKQGWPKDEFRLLCFNCNCSKIFSMNRCKY